jgi:hypothetical protein
MDPDSLPVLERPSMADSRYSKRPPNTFHVDMRMKRYAELIAWLKERGYTLSESFYYSRYVTLKPDDIVLFLLTF